MARAAELAQALVDYDDRVAMRILAHLCADLGGPAAEGDLDVSKMKAFLSQPDAALPEVGDPQTTTAEWKQEFGHYESVRSLAAALASALDR